MGQHDKEMEGQLSAAAGQAVPHWWGQMFNSDISLHCFAFSFYNPSYISKADQFALVNGLLHDGMLLAFTFRLFFSRNKYSTQTLKKEL